MFYPFDNKFPGFIVTMFRRRCPDQAPQLSQLCIAQPSFVNPQGMHRFAELRAEFRSKMERSFGWLRNAAPCRRSCRLIGCDRKKW
jgi:hypothetical protein